MSLPSAIPAATQELCPEVQRLIRDEQERGYRNLAIQMGLGADPRKAYQRLFGVPSSNASSSPYEEPVQHQIMAIILGHVQKALSDFGEQPLKPAPAFATLPSGNIDAKVLVESTSGVPVLFIEQGLFRFFYDFCHLIGWALPSLTPQQLASDKSLTELAHQFTMPFEASESFVTSMATYAFQGNPSAAGPRVKRPDHNLPLCMTLLTLMERFVMVHEMAHIKLGHLKQASSPELEHQADASSLGLVTFMALFHDRIAWGVGYWACEMALAAFNLLYRAIGIAEFGSTAVEWRDRSHPDPLARRDLLRGFWLDRTVPRDGVDAARALCAMSEALIQRLWELASAGLLLARQHGARPSPLWRTLIDQTFPNNQPGGADANR